MRFLEGKNRNESSQGQEDLKFKTILNCQSTPFKLKMELDIVQEVQILGCQKYKVLTIHNSQASEGAIQETASSKNSELESSTKSLI